MKTFKGQAVSKGGAEGMQALAMKTKNGEHVALALNIGHFFLRCGYVP